MKKQVQLKISPDHVDNQQFIRKSIASHLRLDEKRILKINLIRRSIDARGYSPLFVLKYEVDIDNIEPTEEVSLLSNLKNISTRSKKVIIVGAGPAGYFAALECLEQGLKPIVLERGKDVRQRRRDLRNIQQFGRVNPDSNYCFGEGGAGTYSDGKLYTRSHKRGSIEKVLHLFVEHGAKSDILIDAHPHIGSNKLPTIIKAIRKTIEDYGGEIHFEKKVVDFVLSKRKILGVKTAAKEFLGDAVILATGHSARDIFQLCERYELGLEFKPFAIGVRIEHPQELIDDIQYNGHKRGEHLPAASYKLVCQFNGTSVFSFCMCPGGLIVPSATAPGELVVNGMSLSKRDSPYANSGVVIALDEGNIPDFAGKFSGVAFQLALEQLFFRHGDGSQTAPAQLLTDFVNGKGSNNLRETSYIPGLYSANFKELLPDFIYQSLAGGIKVFDQKLKGYYTEEAQVIGLESRTSSPVKIPRNKDNLMHNEVDGLFPCGEGAGYAGGILSAAMDGQNVAKAISKWLTG